jgi:hypothetical protein
VMSAARARELRWLKEMQVTLRVISSGQGAGALSAQCVGWGVQVEAEQ